MRDTREPVRGYHGDRSAGFYREGRNSSFRRHSPPVFGCYGDRRVGCACFRPSVRPARFSHNLARILPVGFFRPVGVSGKIPARPDWHGAVGNRNRGAGFAPLVRAVGRHLRGKTKHSFRRIRYRVRDCMVSRQCRHGASLRSIPSGADRAFRRATASFPAGIPSR